MMNKPTRWKLVLFVLLGFLLGIFVGIKITTLRLENSIHTEHAVRDVQITIDTSQQEELFSQLQNFADKWGYAIRIAPLDPNGKSFSVQMWRSDVKLSGLYPNDPATLNIGFFYTNPAIPVPIRYIDEEINDLEGFIREIPGATFVVEK